MKVIIALIFTLVLCSCISANNNELEIKIDKGTIRGTYRQSLKGRKIISFTGIPYAKPPVGKLRFEPPVEGDAWTGILDASKPHSVCPQIDVFFNEHEVKGNEDCLYLNVYKPQELQFKDKLLPVLFYIHGGGYFSGNGNADLYGPDNLLDQDVILVTINYRLGSLGFLSTGDDIVPGNNGLKDQSFALKWTKNNVVYFGGDPNKITIFGQSAGGGSAHYHVLSPLSRGLFNAAIAHSGSAVTFWSIAPEGQQVRNVKKLGSLLNCSVESSKELVECLRNVDAYDIIEKDKAFMEFSFDPEIPFKPVVEPELEGAFITKHPVDIIKSGEVANVPLIFGITTDDGAFKTTSLYNDSKLIERFNKDFYHILPLTLLYDETATENDTNYITSQAKDFYLGNKTIDDTTKSQLTNLYTDFQFFHPSNFAARLHVKYTNAPVYYFVFGYKGSITLAPFLGDSTYDYGVCHGDDINYILSSALYGNYKPTISDQKIIDLLTTIWVNVAKTGDPTPNLDNIVKTKWFPIEDEEKLLYYFIKNEKEAEMIENIYSERAKFWEKLPLYSKKNSFKADI